MPFWHPKGMVIWNALEDLRRRENAKRGYVEVKTPLMYDVETWKTSGHWEKFKDEMFLDPVRRGADARPQADELPGPHAAVRLRRCAATATCRCATPRPRRCTATSAAGTLHGLLRVQHVTQDDAHIFVHAGADRGRDLRARSTSRRYLYELFGIEARFELSTRPDNKLGTDEEWDFTEGALRAALDRRGIQYTVNEGDGAFYGPKIDLHMTDVLGRSWQMGTIQLDSQMPAALRPHLHGRRQRGAHAVRDPPRAASARSSASSGS